MSRGKFRYEWTPFVAAPKHTISNEHLVCCTQAGNLHLCRFENEQFVTLDGVPIEHVTAYQNDEPLANALRMVLSGRFAPPQFSEPASDELIIRRRMP